MGNRACFFYTIKDRFCALCQNCIFQPHYARNCPQSGRYSSSGYSQSASLRSSTPNNCSAVYQEELALLLIQASPHTLLIAFRNPAGDLLDLVKPCLLTYSPFFVKVKALKQRVDFSVPTFFATQPAPFRRDRLCGFYCVKKARSVSHT